VLAVAAVLGWWGAEPSWAPITLDPIATRVEVLEGVAYLPFGVRKFLS
jgi:hypothetical protein